MGIALLHLDIGGEGPDTLEENELGSAMGIFVFEAEDLPPQIIEILLGDLPVNAEDNGLEVEQLALVTLDFSSLARWSGGRLGHRFGRVGGGMHLDLALEIFESFDVLEENVPFLPFAQINRGDDLFKIVVEGEQQFDSTGMGIGLFLVDVLADLLQSLNIDEVDGFPGPDALQVDQFLIELTQHIVSDFPVDGQHQTLEAADG